MWLPLDLKILDHEEKFVSDPGERFRPVYTPEILDNGDFELVQTGVEDLEEIYNSMRDSCDIGVLVQKYLQGDETALQRGNPVFLDLLGAPKSLMEAYQLQVRAERAFNNLPAEIKEKFGNSFGTFLAGAGTPDWFENLKISKDSVDVKEVDTSES